MRRPSQLRWTWATAGGESLKFKIVVKGSAAEQVAGESTAAVSANDEEPLEIDEACVVELQWEPAAADGGSAILGHRLLASYETPSYVSPWLPLVANSSAARTRLDGVPLLPSARYSLAVAALNSVGVGATSAVASYSTADAPAAAYELRIGRWARAMLPRGGAVRHRFFVPVATDECVVTAQVGARQTRTPCARCARGA